MLNIAKVKIVYLAITMCVSVLLLSSVNSASGYVVPITNPDFVTDVDGWTFFPYPSDAGGNMAWHSYNAPGSTGGSMVLGAGFAYQDLAASIAPDTDYTLSVALRNHNDNPTNIMFNLIVVESNEYIIDMRPRSNGVWDPPLAVGEWGTWTDTVYAEDLTDYLGETLRVQFYVNAAWAQSDHWILTADGPIYGDLDGDTYVSDNDLDIIINNWGQSVTPGDLLSGDVTGDGFVNADDLDIVQANWNVPPTMASSVPEPASLVLLFSSFVLLASRRRNRA